MAISQKRREEYATVAGDKYPIPPHDKNHAKAALALINKAKPALSSEQKMAVIKRAHAVLSGK